MSEHDTRVCVHYPYLYHIIMLSIFFPPSPVLDIDMQKGIQYLLKTACFEDSKGVSQRLFKALK